MDRDQFELGNLKFKPHVISLNVYKTVSVFWNQMWYKQSKKYLNQWLKPG